MRNVALRRWLGICTILIFAVALAACGEDEVGGSGTAENQDEQENQPGQQNQDHPDVCSDHDDCDPPEICVVDEPGQEGLCQEPEDNRADGEECTDSAQCESGLCVDGVCTSECDDASDCVDGWLCREYDDYSICEEPTPCDSIRDCSFDGDHCVVERDDDLRVICRPPAGDGELGDSCSIDGDCAAGLCLDGECSQPCANPSDCGDDEEYLCTGEELVDGQSANVCTERPPEACLSDVDCDGEERCVATIDEDSLYFACGEPNDGGGEGGDICTDDSDCAQNLCIDGACAAPCNDDDVCTDIPASSCHTTSVERDDIEGTVSVCEVPVLCDSVDDCLADETCYFEVEDDAVHTVCNDPNATNRGDGESCSNDLQCASNYCHEDRFGDYCVTPCVSDSDCPDVVDGYPMECGEVEVEYGSGSGSETIAACVHQTPDPCVDDSQCDADEACAVVVNETQDGLTGACLPDNGGAEPGESCSTNSDCRNQLCFIGKCSAPCAGDDVCGDFQQCNEAAVGKDGQIDNIDICTDPVESPCDAPLHCDHQNMTCNKVTSTGGQVDGAACGLINPGQADLGQTCADGQDCESNFCWSSEDGINGECSVFCQDSARDCASSQVCTGLVAGLGACLASCDTNQDCVGGNVCQVGIEPDESGIHGICDQTVGNGQTGDVCENPGDCETGLCLTVSTYEVTDTSCSSDSHCDSGFECRCPPDTPNCLNTICVSEEPIDVQTRCTEMCDPSNGDADCGGGHDMTVCSDDIVYSWNGQSDTVSLCSLPNADID